MAAWIAEAFRDRTDKTFRKDTYDQFTKSTLPGHGLTQADFERFARHEVGIQHLVALAGAAGRLVPPQEAEALFKRENEQREAEVVGVFSSNYVAQVTVETNDVATYYTNQQAVYRIPEKIQVSYVKFAASNYLAEAEQELAKNTNVNQYVESIYLQRGTNAFLDASNQPLNPDAAKQKIRSELKENLALEEARKKAVEFANELFATQEKEGALEKLAAAKGLTNGVTQPFGQFETPPGLAVPPAFGQAAAKLTKEEPFAEQLIQAQDGIYIIALKERIPSEIPPLDTIMARVTQDYKNSKALELARAAGRELHTAITNGLAEGKTFSAVAAEKSFTPVTLAPFARKETMLPSLPNRADAPQVVSTAFQLTPGKVSEFVPTRSGGFVVHVKGIVPVSEEKLKAELPEYTKNLRQSRQFEAFSEWFRKQTELARVNLPGDTEQASPN
jgi:peptidyl-prolyl cis-trans isomerase D